MTGHGRALRSMHVLPKIALGALLLGAIAVMLVGVFLRYVMVPVTDALDLPAINFFWVEETGETLLAWLALLGAGVGIAERAHFGLTIVVHRLSPRLQRVIRIVNLILIAVFGGFLAWQGWKLAALNALLGSPALGISLAWLYSSAFVGGVAIVLYAITGVAGAAADPKAPGA